MSLLSRFLAGFLRKRTPPPARASTPVSEIVAQMKARAQPCLRVIAGGSGRSWLGGRPQMAGAWPQYDGRPLGFVAQIDLAEARAADGPEWLPAEGRLLFFYDLEHGGWGFDPKDVGSFAVRHESAAAARATPPAALADDAQFDEFPVTFAAAVSYPDQDRLEVNWQGFAKEAEDALEAELVALAPPEPAHQVGGFPDALQNDDMELECERVTSGLFRGKSPSQGDKQSGPADWRLLLQLDTDDEAGMMWGDTGRLYFWVRERDARAGDFSKAWMILQCF